MSWLSQAVSALTGNRHDGVYGERSGVEGFDQRVTDYKIEYNDELRLKWLARNPGHNLSFGILRKPDGPFWAWSAFGFNGYIGFRPNKPKGGETPEQLAWLAERDGAFGIALRRGDKKYGE